MITKMILYKGRTCIDIYTIHMTPDQFEKLKPGDHIWKYVFNTQTHFSTKPTPQHDAVESVIIGKHPNHSIVLRFDSVEFARKDKS